MCKKREYEPKTDKIALDLGLSNLFATNFGDLFGRRFIDYLLKMDEKITTLQARLQKNKLKPTLSKRYRRLIKKTRDYLKNEINRIINKIIKLYSPKEIVIERLNFQSPKLSKRLNRILHRFGKRLIKQKLESLKEEFGIKITEVNPAYSSQTCSKCGYVDKNNRKNQATFICGFCNSKQNSDVNAAKNLLFRSSKKLISSIYTKKAQILDELIKQFIERYNKQVYSCPAILSNHYFNSKLLDRIKP
jgi:putative transposase